jgi:hypothetical protein
LRTRRLAIALGIVVLAVVALIATAPHPWVGKLWCDIQGGEWTNRFDAGSDEIVTGGRTCVK